MKKTKYMVLPRRFDKFVVVAGNREEFLSWCRRSETDIDTTNCVYVDTYRQLVGLDARNALILYGTYQDRTDYLTELLPQIALFEKSPSAMTFVYKPVLN